MLPRAVVYDAGLMLSLPVPMSVASGLNALAHCVDSMWAPRADPIDQALALEGIRALAAGLPEVVRRPARPRGPSSRPCTGPTWPRSRSRRPAPACTTRSATCSAGCTTCRTRRRTPWCCRTCSPSTPPPSPRSSGGSAAAFEAPSALEGLRRLRSAAGRSARPAGLRPARGRHPRRRRRRARDRPARQPQTGDRGEPRGTAARRLGGTGTTMTLDEQYRTVSGRAAGPRVTPRASAWSRPSTTPRIRA